MSEDKLSSDEVPGKFAEWLLSMGCSAEKVPSVDKVAEMCRGQYYMVWRSLMEHVEAKDMIRSKRLQVFCDDIRRCQKKTFNQHGSNALVPDQLTLWMQGEENKQKEEDVSSRLSVARQDLDELMDKNSCKLTQRNLSRSRMVDVQRRAWFIQQVAEDLCSKKVNLHETKSIAESICSIDEGADIQSKLDKCIASLRRHSALSSISQLPNPVASSSVVSTSGEITDYEDHLSCIVKTSGDALCSQLYERHARLVRELATSDVAKQDASLNRLTPQSVLAHTAALHCSLALEATKNRIHLKHAHKQLVSSVTELNNYLTREACELLVLRCEKAHVEARVGALRSLLDEVAGRSGIFEPAGQAEGRSVIRPIRDVDRAIESKREELKRVIASLSATERKIQNVKEYLVAVFNGFCDDSPTDVYRFRGPQLDLPQESIPTLRQFYETRRETRKQKIDLSMQLEVSDRSVSDAIDLNNPKFLDELRIYLKKFNLEKNRKLVLDSGEKVWIFETLQSSLDRLHTRWQSDDTSCSLICPSDSLANNLHRVIQDVQHRDVLGAMLRQLECAANVEIDRHMNITQEINIEEQIIDKIKKRLKENLQNLQKTDKTLHHGQDTLKLWSDNNMRKYISDNRTVNGMLYKDYELYYLDGCISL